jgi:hypothetical protein
MAESAHFVRGSFRSAKLRVFVIELAAGKSPAGIRGPTHSSRLALA